MIDRLYNNWRGIHSNQIEKKLLQCYLCSENHRVLDCPTLASCSSYERIQHARTQRLCFSCLDRGHVTKNCKSKERCGTDGCPYSHHRLLHRGSLPKPPAPHISSARSALGKQIIIPVVRVRLKSVNGKNLGRKHSRLQWRWHYCDP